MKNDILCVGRRSGFSSRKLVKSQGKNCKSLNGGRLPMKRLYLMAAMGAALLATSAFAAKGGSYSVASTATPSGVSPTEIVVPLTIKYDKNLTAMDIPLSYSDGVTLTRVELGSMLDNYDFKIANIDAENNLLIIGAINMIYSLKADLPAGEGTVAQLFFTVDDPTLESFTIEVAPQKNPTHDLFLVYDVYDENNIPHVVMVTPEFAPIEVALSGGTSVASAKPTSFSLDQNFPNPFNPSTKINYDILNAGLVKLEIYNVLGQRVRILVNEHKEAASYTVEWDGRDNNGGKVSSGVYFYKVNANNGEFVQTRKMVMLK
ncbi:MAG: T9SS type A sorting domain-containing protein [candidate division Zixibacteria bacterium]|nr:T9SS type A sorting domain-containing protein [candidate division Zixibacteria bacterium]